MDRAPFGALGGGEPRGAQVLTNTDLLVVLQHLVALLSRTHIYRYTAYIDRRSSPPPPPVFFVRAAPSQALAGREKPSSRVRGQVNEGRSTRKGANPTPIKAYQHFGEQARRALGFGLGLTGRRSSALCTGGGLFPSFRSPPVLGQPRGSESKKEAGDVTLEHEPPALTIGIG